MEAHRVACRENIADGSFTRTGHYIDILSIFIIFMVQVSLQARMQLHYTSPGLRALHLHQNSCALSLLQAILFGFIQAVPLNLCY